MSDVVADRFELLEIAGAGGMGTVYRALDRPNDRACALKILRRDSGDLERFEREASVLEKLTHPGIVAYVDHGFTDAGDAWLAMEWAEGRTLRDLLEERTLTPREAVELARDVAGALVVAHAAGIIHRDLKPSNLMLRISSEGRIEGTKVLDFGVARARGDGADLTLTGQVIGTPGYMAPEQARGHKDIDERADVFALGCVIFRAITGRPAFEAEDVLAVLTLLALYEPPLLGDVADGVPEELEALVARMLAKDKSRRPASAAEVLAGLEIVRALGDDAWRRSARGAKTAPQKRKRIELEVSAPPEIGEDSTLAEIDPLARPHPALIGKGTPERAPETPEHPKSPPEVETLVSVSGRTLVLRPGRRVVPIGVGLVAGAVATVLLWPASSPPPPAATAPSASEAPTAAGVPPPTRELLWSKGIRGTGASSVKAVAAGGEVVFVGADVRGAWTIGDPIQARGDAGPVLENGLGRDGVVAMFRRDGHVGWATPFTNGSKDVDVRAVETRGESVWVVGLFEGELGAGEKRIERGEGTGLFLAELSALSGSVRSLRAFGEVDANFYLAKFGLAILERDVIIAGGYSGSLDLGCGKRTAKDLDPFVARLDAQGKCSWSPEMSGGGLQTIDSVGVDLAGDVVVAGEYTNTLRLSPSEPGGLAVDRRYVSSSGGIDFFIMKFDPEGKVAWHQAWGAPLAIQGGAAIAVHPLGAIGFTGWFEGALNPGAGVVQPKAGADVLVAALDPQGKLLFAKPLGLERAACPKDRCNLDHLGVAMDKDGNVSVAAPLSGTSTPAAGAAVPSAGATDLLVVTFAPTGDLVSAFRAGDERAQCQASRCWYALASDLDGGLYAAGWFSGVLAPGIEANDREDGFLLRMGRPDR